MLEAMAPMGSLASSKFPDILQICMEQAVSAHPLDSYGYQIEKLYNFGMPRSYMRFTDRCFRVTHHRDHRAAAFLTTSTGT